MDCEIVNLNIMNKTDYKNKYLKYKNKYFNMKGGFMITPVFFVYKKIKEIFNFETIYDIRKYNFDEELCKSNNFWGIFIVDIEKIIQISNKEINLNFIKDNSKFNIININSTESINFNIKINDSDKIEVLKNFTYYNDFTQYLKEQIVDHQYIHFNGTKIKLTEIKGMKDDNKVVYKYDKINDEFIEDETLLKKYNEQIKKIEMQIDKKRLTKQDFIHFEKYNSTIFNNIKLIKQNDSFISFIGIQPVNSFDAAIFEVLAELQKFEVKIFTLFFDANQENFIKYIEHLCTNYNNDISYYTPTQAFFDFIYIFFILNRCNKIINIERIKDVIDKINENIKNVKQMIKFNDDGKININKSLEITQITNVLYVYIFIYIYTYVPIKNINHFPVINLVKKLRLKNEQMFETYKNFFVNKTIIEQFYQYQETKI